MTIKKNEELEQKETERPKVESNYTVKELSENAAKVFGSNVRSECVVAAFWNVGKETATLKEAIEIVSKFMKKEVK